MSEQAAARPGNPDVARRDPHDRSSPIEERSTGRFAHDLLHDTWTWSPGVFRIHGFEPGQVVPSTELMRAHVYADDQEAARVVTDDPGTDSSFSGCYRIVDARRDLRHVVVVGHTTRGPDGRTASVSGLLVDVTDASRSLGNLEVDRAVEDFKVHRAIIEQAKGVLVQLLSVDSEQAFLLLRRISQHENVKVRDLAESLVDAAAHDRTPAKHDTGGSVLEQLTRLVT
jgi:hypothetical protein